MGTAKCDRFWLFQFYDLTVRCRSCRTAVFPDRLLYLLNWIFGPVQVSISERMLSHVDHIDKWGRSRYKPSCLNAGPLPTFEATGLAPRAILVREPATQERAFRGCTTSPAVSQRLPGFSLPAHTRKFFRPIWKKSDAGKRQKRSSPYIVR